MGTKHQWLREDFERYLDKLKSLKLINDWQIYWYEPGHLERTDDGEDMVNIWFDNIHNITMKLDWGWLSYWERGNPDGNTKS
jgi:hypothetical protein